jgi:hypothetical protein
MYKSNRLFDEFVDVERNMNTGKIDHTPNYHKDALDAVCGATFNASKFAEEFAFDYGESLEDTITVNKASNDMTPEQIALEFEAEMQRLLTPIKEQSENKDNKSINNVFNNMPSNNAYVLDNMIIW